MADDFQFNPDQWQYQPRGAGRPGGLSGWVMKLLGSTNPALANKVLVAVALLFFLAAALILVIYL